MKPVFIHSAVCISAQATFEAQAMKRLPVSEAKAKAIHPNYRDYIPPAAARRMAPAVKMGVTAATKALEQANLTQPDAIITGSGMGCMQDTEKFLNALLENNEAFLAPTAFIQSTHNTVGGQIALGLKCKAYNTTYVHGSLSFESALLDAQLALQEDTATNVLVGGLDELGTEFVDYVAHYEQAHPQPIKVPYSEGAGFLVLSSIEPQRGIQLKGVATFGTASEYDIVDKLKTFLAQHHRSIADIDVLFLGKTGDSFDGFYDLIAHQFSKETEQVSFKEFSGAFYTAVSFALWWAYYMLAHQCHPGVISEPNHAKNYTNIIVYNQEKGSNHSFTLLTR